MMSPKPPNFDSRAASSLRHTPLQIIHVFAMFLRIWSVYSLYHYLAHQSDSVVAFIFSCLVPASLLFLVLQKPWKGRPLPNTQVIPTVINGGIMALYFILWGKGLLSCGPLIALLAEYAGAVLGVLSAALYGRRAHIWKKVSCLKLPLPICINFLSVTFITFPNNSLLPPGDRPTHTQLLAISVFISGFLLIWYKANLASFELGSGASPSSSEYSAQYQQVHKVGGLVAMLASYYALSKGWATRTNSPFYSFGKESIVQEKQTLDFKELAVPLSAGILSALRRVIARRVSLKNQLKRRLHAISVASATCFLFPLAMWDTILGSTSDSIVKFQFPSWAYLSTILFGIIFIFYADNIAEERLHLVFSSPRHLMISGGCIILMEILYQMNFSLFGFVACCSVLGFGIYEATSLGRMRKGPSEPQDAAEGSFQDELQMAPLPS